MDPKDLPAFPNNLDPRDPNGKGGMALRDFFAAKAMEGMLAGEPGPHQIPENAANSSYEYADAMLKARDARADGSLDASLYRELIYAVGHKYPGETCHQTILRYIRNAEAGSSQAHSPSTKEREA